MMRTAMAGLALAATLSAPVLAKDVVDVADLVEKQGPAVVNISTTKLVKRSPDGLPFTMPDEDEMQDFFRRFFPPGGPGGPGGPMQEIPARGAGSGFIVSSDGYILTNAHVVKNADEVVVKLIDKRKFIAKVVGADTRTDVAVLKIPAGNLPTVKLGDPIKLRVGEAVAAIGSPFGFENSVTAGIVSAKGRSLPSENYVPYIQTDVPINPGNSGGPLFNMKGEVVGINSQIYSRSGGYQGVSFAIPIDVAMEVVGQLKAGGKVSRGWLGVVIQEVTADLAESFGLDRPRGALVAQVQADSPAAKAGLQPADVILEFNGKPVENSGDLPRMVGMAKPGTQTPATVWRKGKSMQLNVVLGELPTETAQGESESKSFSRGGLALSELNAEQKRALELTYGLRVEEATGDAARAGIRPGDIILAVNNTRVSTVDAFRKAIAAVPVGRSAAILVRRGEGSLYIPLKISGE
ncbi:MAG: protease Do [Hydrogenophilales bacterium 16-64-46]|nr:MAG: protease Do [Hydrogenophilales bacterium 12-64-13]OYZ05975.1 MAG: protease Do [Hydrogenophilales bacterium 16-64-46]OZA39911.1 MAG: protease Do [Hydrogenophilales bacterium 17-64-34]HQT00339.1 DegQ family serine endoprotease [Thiobacillus sp.]